MGKGKKRKAPMAPQEHKREEPANLFERISNKKRFNILGRKVKGDVRQTGKLRSAATERRKDTLLVEYRQLRKSNAFIDRRFGEDDKSLTADEKALLRFQKQRLKEVAGSKFTLADEDGEGGGDSEQLTHMGRSLAELEDLQEDWRSDDEGDVRLEEELVQDYHFGGGLFERKQSGAGEGGEEGDEGGRRQHKKSKKEVMAEIIAKSKMFKAEKQRQREEDADETSALDDQFRSLMGDRVLLGLMRKKGQKRDARAASREDPFDVLIRELVFEAKAKPGERTLTAEELADLERQRLEALEAQRCRRMQGEEDEDEAEEGEGAAGGQESGAGRLPAGGYAKRRAKRACTEEFEERRLGGGASDDALEDDFASISGDEGDASLGGDFSDSQEEGEEEGVGCGGRPLTTLELRRQARAAGAHPLQQALREVSARLLKKHSKGTEDSSSSEEGSEDAEEDGLESSSGSEKGSEDGEEEVGEKEEEQEAVAVEAAGAGTEEDNALVRGSSSSEEEEEQQQQQAEAARKRHKAATAAKPVATLVAAPAVPLGVSADLPYTPPLPDSYEAFAQLVGRCSAADLAELVRRMRVVHAASLNSENRKKLQLLYGILVQHFASLGGRRQPGSGVPLEHLDALVPHLVELTPQVPFYSATLARMWLVKAQEWLAGCLRDSVLQTDAWPSSRILLLLKLFATVFPASDKRHPVLTPAGLLACSCLSNCPVAKPQHVATGLYLASLAVHLHSQARRYVPEPLCFAVLALQGVLPAGSGPASPSNGSHQRQLAPEEPRWLAIASGDAGADRLPGAIDNIEPLDLVQVLGSGSGSGSSSSKAGGEEYWHSAGFKTSAAAAAVWLVGRCAELLAGNVALPEVLAPAQAALRSIVVAAGEAQASAALPATSKKPRKQKGKATATAGAVTAATTVAAAPAVVVAPGLVQLCHEVLQQLEAAVEAIRGSRRPMYNVHLLKVAEKRQYNPRFEEDFVSGKDYDPDRERSERRKLQRAIKREERGAARELRRDAAFMSDVRDREKAAKQAELFASERRAKSFLQAQEADFKSGGQGGMWKKKKKK